MRGTAAPEDPIITRVYLCEDGSDSPATMERKFHSLLSAAGHVREVAVNSGREWFLTNEVFLDAIADVLGYQKSAGN
jgi:hypothetical protein